MGLIRKTASISTLGIVNFRSKKERLRRAERAFTKATSDLEVEQAARTEADRRVAAAEKRAHGAELTALQEAKAAAKAKRRARGRASGRKAKRAAALEAKVAALVGAAQPAVVAKAEEARRKGKDAAGRAGKVSRRAAARARHEAEPRMRAAATVAGDLADKAKDRLPLNG